jgi:outer membrane protein assembly factor BamE
MTQRLFALYLRATKTVLLAACLALSACVYRIDIQQGNLLEEDNLEQVQVGMTRSQVQFLLGTPMVADPFHQQRWDYRYYLKPGRSNEVTESWVIVFFEGDIVSRIERDADPNASS